MFCWGQEIRHFWRVRTSSLFRGRYRTSDIFASPWQAQYFVHITKHVGRNERCCRRQFFLQAIYVVNVDDVLQGSKCSFWAM